MIQGIPSQHRVGLLAAGGVLLVLASLFVPGRLQAQDQSPRFKHLSLEQGLSNAHVRCIIQDRNGFMWFGTKDGLNKYDGYEMTVYKLVPEDPSGIGRYEVRALYEDQEGILWIGTWGYGLGRFDPITEQVTYYRHDPDDLNSLRDNRVTAITEDREGVLWIGAFGGGLSRLDRTTGRFTNYRHDPDDPHSLSDNRVVGLYKDRGGMLWISTEGGGLNRFDPATRRFMRYQHDPDDPNSLSNNHVLDVVQDRDGILWIGLGGGPIRGNSGLNRFDPATGQFTSYRYDPNDPHSLSDNTVRALHEDRSGTLWVAASGGGLNWLDRTTGHFTRYQHDPNDPNSLSDDLVRVIYEDRAGWLWIGTVSGGVDHFNPAPRRLTLFEMNAQDPYSLSGSTVRAIYEDPNHVLWVGMAGAGLDRLDRATGRFSHRVLPAGNSLRAIYESPSEPGVLWIGSRTGGLERYDRRTGQSTRYRNDPNDPHSLSNNWIRVIHEDRAGTLWIGTYGGGLNQFDRTTGRFTRFQHDPNDPTSLSDNTVRAIYEDRSGTLWIGTGGLNRLDRTTGRFTRFQHDPHDPHSLSNDIVNTLYEDSRGTFWIGTRGGLNRLDRATGRFTRLLHRDLSSPDEEWLPRDEIRGIVEDDDGNLWLSTANGLSILHATPDEGFNLRHYEVIDDVYLGTFYEGAYHKGRRGELFFGGEQGLYIFDHALLSDAAPPPVFITNVKLFGDPVAVRPDGSTPLTRHISDTETITLPPDADIVTFSFAALDYADPARTEYAYKLDGFHDDWIYQGSKREATFTDLRPGTYTLRVKAANSAGVWNETGTSLRVVMLPAWWQTWWFRIGAALALMGLVIGGYRLRVRRVEWQNRLLQKEIEQRKLSEEVLRHVILDREQGQQQMQLMADALPVLIAFVDTEERYQFNNATYEHLLGLNPDDLQGRTLRESLGETAYAVTSTLR